jgi:DNA adenine methylase
MNITMNITNVASIPQRSPFRYPGGKTWLVPHIRAWLSGRNRPLFIEPFAGGAQVGLTAGFEGLARHVVLVEKDPAVASVWKTILGGQAEGLARRIEEFKLTRENVTEILQTDPLTVPERAFVTLLRNRVQRGGIMAAGAGLLKAGENGRGLLSRWYPQTLARRIREIGALRHTFTFIEGDGLEAIAKYGSIPEAAFYIDPPYTLAARRLYTHWQIDHAALFNLVFTVAGDVLMTYDDTAEVRFLASCIGFKAEPVAMRNTHHRPMTELLLRKNVDNP